MYLQKTKNIIIIIIWIIYFSIHNIYANNNIIPSILNNNQESYYIINNNVMTLYINVYNSNIEHIWLKKYFANNDYNQYTKLFTKQKKYNYINNTNFVIYEKHKNNIINIPWKNIKTKITTNNIYIYTYHNYKNIIWKRKILLGKNSYLLNITYNIYNSSQKKKKIRIINSLIQTKNINNPQFVSYFNKNKNNTEIYNIYNNKTYNNILTPKTQSWISLHDNYFISIWLPIFNNNWKYINIYSKLVNNNYILSYESNNITLYPQKNITIQTKLWTGPKIFDDLNHIHNSLTNTINYGKWQLIILYIRKIFNIINNYSKHWIFTITFIILIFKIITYPINKWQIQTIKKLNKIIPIFNKIKSQYITTPNKYYYKIKQIYQKYKINPIYSILPIIIQIPIIVIIIKIINNTVEIKHYPFLWIKDLTYNDKYFFLPIITSISIYLTQPQQLKKTNKYTFYLISIFMIFLMSKLSSGILLYYLINNMILWLQKKILHI